MVKSLIRVLAFLSLFVWSPNVSAQMMCDIFGPPYSTSMPPGFLNIGVTFQTGSSQPTDCVLNTAGPTANGLVCSLVLTAAGNYNCPAGMGSCVGLLAMLPTNMVTAMAHSCEIMCNCGFGFGVETFTISNADGLPVELMDFYIDDAGDTQNPETTKPPADTTEDVTVSRP